ncbi:MAG: DeoR family transcriptional regulator [Deltaproteobacteria bacterium]|nr:DeoR family transcriptional regulator [Deltaproteobacteria bacterium]MBW2395541.1 DeoR family transcriptional regulator [Deltaproteobacteria bacterium]
MSASSAAYRQQREDAAASKARSTTRNLLLEILKRSGECDVTTLAQQLGVSSVAVRRHLTALECDGMVGARLERRPVGRPARLYSLTDAAADAFPRASERVALDLLARLEEMMGAEALDRLLRARLGDLQKQYGERLDRAESWRDKLEILTRLRDEEGYLCNLKPAVDTDGEHALHLVEHHCPMADIARQHPKVCGFELELFRLVLGEPEIRRVEHILGGGRTCTYVIPLRSGRGEAAGSVQSPAEFSSFSACDVPE